MTPCCSAHRPPFEEDRIQVNVMPKKLKDGEDAELTTPLSVSGTAEDHLQGGMRLISKKRGVVLWADDVSSGRFARSASSSFAESVAKSLGRLFADRQKK